MEYYAVTTYDGLYHHGIKGQHWGVRRFQNEDGSVTAAGAKRYMLGQGDYHSSVTKKYSSSGNKAAAKASADFDKKITQYRQSQSSGKRFVKEYFMGPAGSLTYDMARVNNKGRVGSFLRSVIDINAASIVGTGVNAGVQKALSKDETVYTPEGSVTTRKTGPVAKIGGFGAGYAVNKALVESGAELSLQQRHQRNKYINKQLKKQNRR